jgi:hypothetical protein
MDKLDLLRLLPLVIRGAEGEEDEGQGNSEGEGGNASGDANGSTAGASGDAEGDNSNEDDATKGLKSALEKERKAARDAQKELNRLKKQQEDAALKEKSEVEQAQAREQKAAERAQKLAAGLLRRDIDAAIRRAAEESKFIDPTDAVDGVDRSALTFSQDEDDPTEIDIDAKTVERAVKALAAKKPHFLRRGTEDGEPTGSQFGGSKTGKVDKVDTYKQLYPSLR